MVVLHPRCFWCRREIDDELAPSFDGRDFCSYACVDEYMENEGMWSGSD